MVDSDPGDALQCFPPRGPGIDRADLSRDVASRATGSPRAWRIRQPSLGPTVSPGSLRARLTLQVAREDERRIEMAGKIAHFPTARDLDGFDCAAQPWLDPRQIRELAACRWVAHGEVLLLLGKQQSAAIAAR